MTTTQRENNKGGAPADPLEHADPFTATWVLGLTEAIPEQERRTLFQKYLRVAAAQGYPNANRWLRDHILNR